MSAGDTNFLLPPRQVLMVRPTALGDVARTAPALVSLKHAFPEAQIDWLVSDSFADAVRHHPALRRVVPFPRNRFAAMLRHPRVLTEALAWGKALRRQGYDLVVDLQGLFRSGFFTWLSGSPQRVGFADARELGWLGYNCRYRVDAKLHTVDRMLALLAAHGIAPQHDMRLYLGDEDQRWLDDYLRKPGGGDEPYALVAPTARWLCKCWPIDRFADVTQRLLDEKRVARVFVVASPGEQQQITVMRRRFAGNASVIFAQTSVGQLMALVSRTRLLVCNDSAALHIAVGFDRPIVTIFGPTDPAKVGPYRRAETVVQPPNIQPHEMSDYRHQGHDQTLIARVDVEAVYARVTQMLAPSRATPPAL